MRSRLCHRKGRLRKAFSSIRLIPQGCKGGPLESFWLLPERFADLADFVTAEGSNTSMAHRRHCMGGPRSGEAEQAAFQAPCHPPRDQFTAAYTAFHHSPGPAHTQSAPNLPTSAPQHLGLLQTLPT